MRKALGLAVAVGLIAALLQLQSKGGEKPDAPGNGAYDVHADMFGQLKTFARQWDDSKAGKGPPPDPEMLDTIRQQIVKIPPDWPNAKEAADLMARLDAERPTIAKAFEISEKRRLAREADERKAKNLERRKTYARSVEDAALSNWQDVHLATEGKDFTILRIRYVLMTRPLVYHLYKDGTVDHWRDLGFRKVILTDGYDSTWTLTLP